MAVTDIPPITRRRALLAGGMAGLLPRPGAGHAAPVQPMTAQPITLRIAPTTVELAPGITRRVLAYDGQVPGPVLRLPEGRPAWVRVTNGSDAPELVHWHGLDVGAVPDGAAEEGSATIPPGGTLDYRFVPPRAGTRWYHTHTMAMMDFSRAMYSGQFGFLIVEPRRDPGRHDREVLLAAHHWDGALPGIPASPEFCAMPRYRYATFNGRLMQAAEPVRVRQGERVLFRFLNASATEAVSLALPGHAFTVVALDGNPVASPAPVSVITLGVAERVDAIVHMNRPGRWVLGPTDPAQQTAGLGRVIEYAGATGPAIWTPPPISDWDYALFGGPAAPPVEDLRLDGIFPMLFERRLTPDGMEGWTINGRSYADLPPLHVRAGGRYLFRWINLSGCAHPLHLHRHHFTILRRGMRRIGPIEKDTVQIGRFDTIDALLVADNPGDTLFHCHHQMHMDYGFMQMIRYS
ncbi:multicopper oxidase family protein [Gluconacetobacter asukensis]|uniref:Multicopper oxidase family protein n=1 Tax=Gluconacetobacter asukensis TaxID=1017181 RepID=A0A7W4IZ69_9PROT|nr:multicopper oxidase family protein [Gluconacetobacter asukensis]MBB2171739.1 multicopper oxidase family protein [Gluconacetobacter asukensis]